MVTIEMTLLACVICVGFGFLMAFVIDVLRDIAYYVNDNCDFWYWKLKNRLKKAISYVFPDIRYRD